MFNLDEDKYKKYFGSKKYKNKMKILENNLINLKLAHLNLSNTHIINSDIHILIDKMNIYNSILKNITDLMYKSSSMEVELYFYKNNNIKEFLVKDIPNIKNLHISLNIRIKNNISDNEKFIFKDIITILKDI